MENSFFIVKINHNENTCMALLRKDGKADGYPIGLYKGYISYSRGTVSFYRANHVTNDPCDYKYVISLDLCKYQIKKGFGSCKGSFSAGEGEKKAVGDISEGQISIF